MHNTHDLLMSYNLFVPFFAFIINLFLFLTVSVWANAYDPTSVPNNKVGIHILFPEEVIKAAKIINNDDKGAWGYVTIPIQASDRNRDKWQKFFDQCTSLKVIPIIRVATVPDGSNWAKPGDTDLIDFANFLNDLKWPTQNRYVILFNEVNRSDEYGGVVSPEDYADILNNAIDIFKSKSPDFFILPAGLDNAAANTKTSIKWQTYLTRMHSEQPEIFNKIDGWTSHGYPNPDFSSRPDVSGSNRIDSYKYDLTFLRQFTGKTLPVFITEAGWSNKYLSDQQVSFYYQHAFNFAWSDKNIIAVTPFLLDAQDGPFKQFSFIDSSGNLKSFASTVSNFASQGEPKFPEVVQKTDSTLAQTPGDLLPTPNILGTNTEVSAIDIFISNIKKVFSNIKKIF